MQAHTTVSRDAWLQARKALGGWRSFSDLGGHIWEILWMDPKHVQ